MAASCNVFKVLFCLCKPKPTYRKISHQVRHCSPSPGLFNPLPTVAEQEVFVRFGRLAVCLFTAYLFYGAFAMGQVDGLQSYSASSTVVSVPRLIRTNGSVHDDTGKSLTGNIGITFTLYSDPNGQSPVWQEYQTVHLDWSAVIARYSANDDVGLPLEIFSAGEARWLEFVRRTTRNSHEFCS